MRRCRVALGADGKVNLYNHVGTTNAIVDLTGFHTPEYGVHFVPLGPKNVRVVDLEDTVRASPAVRRTDTPCGPTARCGRGAPTTTARWATAPRTVFTTVPVAVPGLRGVSAIGNASSAAFAVVPNP